MYLIRKYKIHSFPFGFLNYRQNQRGDCGLRRNAVHKRQHPHLAEKGCIPGLASQELNPSGRAARFVQTDSAKRASHRGVQKLQITRVTYGAERIPLSGLFPSIVGPGFECLDGLELETAIERTVSAKPVNYAQRDVTDSGRR